MRFLTRGVLFLLIALLLGGGAPVAHAADTFAAVAFSRSTGQWGYGNGFPTKEAAMARARRECGARDATVKWARNAWIALAVSDQNPGGYGWAWAKTAGQARAGAVENCLQHNADARVVVCVRTSG